MNGTRTVLMKWDRSPLSEVERGDYDSKAQA
jgi:hypothetical protein